MGAIVIKQLYTGKSRCFGYVQFDKPEYVQEALKLSGTKWLHREIWVDYATGFPTHLTKKPFVVREDSDVDPSLADDHYVGMRDPKLPWPNKPFWKSGMAGKQWQDPRPKGKKNSK